MILENEEAVDRINSEHNLINRLTKAVRNPNSAQKEMKELFGIEKEPSSGEALTQVLNMPAATQRDSSHVLNMPKREPFQANSPVLPPSASELIADVEKKLKLGLAHDGALEVLCDSVDLLRRNLVNMDPTQPQRVSRVAVEMARVIALIDESRNGSKSGSGSPTIIYKPVMLAETHYEVLTVHE